MRKTQGFVAAMAIASALGWPAIAQAEPHEDVAGAESLFNAGKALLDSGQYTDACAKFAQSKRLAPGLGVTLYLADCYERIGRTASAWTEFRSAEGLARERSDKRADVARGRAQALEPKLERLPISVAPTLPRAGLQLLRDGSPVAQEEWGLAVPVDPGDHVVVVSSPGHEQRTISAHVGPESPTATVQIDRLDEGVGPSADTADAKLNGAPASLPPSAEPPAQPFFAGPAASDPGTTRRWVGVGLIGAGVVGVGVGSIFGLVARSKLDQSNGGPCDASSDRCDASGLSLRKSASGAATVSTIGFAAGAVALGVGIVVYVTAPRKQAANALVIAPAAVANGAGALLRTSF
jgi:hypothetical protein